MVDVDPNVALRGQLAQAAGLALQEWGMVELTLTYVFIAILDQTTVVSSSQQIPWQHEEPQRRTYHAVINAVSHFPLKIDLVSAAMDEADVPPFVWKIWPKLAKQLREKYKKRHEVAHFIIEPVEDHRGNVTSRLIPFPSSIGEENETRLTVKDIDAKKVSFSKLGMALRWIWEELEVHRRRASSNDYPEPELIESIRKSFDLPPRGLKPKK
ncbi:MAG: hypothetical protein V4530_08080 [Pseudomonadota bacterium]